MNNYTATGRLVAEPVGKELPNDSYVCELRIAVDGMGRGGRDEAGFIDVHSYGDSGKAAAKVLSRGWLVAVAGRLQHDTWEQDGQKRSKHLIVGHVEFLTAPRGQADSEAVDAGAFQPAPGDDDIPF